MSEWLNGVDCKSNDLFRCEGSNPSLCSNIESKTMKKEQSTKHEEEYVAFLQKRIQSANYKDKVSKEEFKKTKEKYSKAKLKLKMMKEGVWK